MVEKFKNDILACADIVTEDDYLYFKDNNTAMQLLKTFVHEGQTFYLVIIDEKYPQLFELFNKVKEVVKPGMLGINYPATITTAEINNILKLICIVLGNIDFAETIISSFSTTDDLLNHYGLTRTDEEDFIQDEFPKPIFSDELKDNVIAYVLPECKSVKLDMIEIKAAEPDRTSKTVCTEIARVIQSYESKLQGAAEDMESVAEKATSAEAELKLCKKEALINKEELVDKTAKIKLLEEKYKQADTDLEIALKKIDILENAPKIIDEEDILDDEDIAGCAEYLAELPADAIKGILLKFLNDKSASAASKSPFALQVFDYIMN